MSGIQTLPMKSSFQFSPECYLSNKSPNHNKSQSSMSFPLRNSLKKSTIIFSFYSETLPRNNRRSSPALSSLYEILRVKENASAVEIKTAYRNLAKKVHPDVATSESDSRDFMEIHKAYTTLSDPTARANYDLSIARSSVRYGYGIGMTNQSSPSDFMVVGQMRRWETDQCW
ncbi:chaperone protein dnaJ 11, chloroplastic-like [Papaver somniferum]|nr:chaperone protein dnaJ 11, chloroplastic-like [Papaver somniferum]